MERNRIYIPAGSLTNEEMESVAVSLFKCGYTVKKGKTDKNSTTVKAAKYIEFWFERG